MERWKDNLAALVPFYDAEGGNATLIYTETGEVFEDHRTVKWNVRRLARLFCVDLEAARRKQADYLLSRQGVPLPLSPALVLVPLKTRRAVGKNDGCHSYLNPAAVRGLAAVNEGDARSVLTLPGEHLLPCRYTLKTVRRRLRDGAAALERHRDALLKREPTFQIPPGDYRFLLERFIYSLIEGSGAKPGG